MRPSFPHASSTVSLCTRMINGASSSARNSNAVVQGALWRANGTLQLQCTRPNLRPHREHGVTSSPPKKVKKEKKHVVPLLSTVRHRRYVFSHSPQQHILALIGRQVGMVPPLLIAVKAPLALWILFAKSSRGGCRSCHCRRNWRCEGAFHSGMSPTAASKVS